MRAWLRFFEEVPTVAVRFPSYNAAFVRHFSKMTDDEFQTLAKSKPLRDKFLGEMDKTQGFSTDKLKSAEDSIRKTVTRMEPALSANDYLLGPQLTLADFCVLPAMIRMDDLGYEFLWKDKPGVKAWLARIKAGLRSWRHSIPVRFCPSSIPEFGKSIRRSARPPSATRPDRTSPWECWSMANGSPTTSGTAARMTERLCGRRRRSRLRHCGSVLRFPAEDRRYHLYAALSCPWATAR